MSIFDLHHTTWFKKPDFQARMGTSMPSGTDTTTDEAPCRFLRLPAELRIMIYEYALQSEANLCPYYPSTNTCFGRIIEPNSTRVNKQIRSETLPVFYGTSTFILAYIGNLDDYI